MYRQLEKKDPEAIRERIEKDMKAIEKQVEEDLKILEQKPEMVLTKAPTPPMELPAVKEELPSPKIAALAEELKNKLIEIKEKGEVEFKAQQKKEEQEKAPEIKAQTEVKQIEERMEKTVEAPMQKMVFEEKPVFDVKVKELTPAESMATGKKVEIQLDRRTIQTLKQIKDEVIMHGEVKKTYEPAKVEVITEGKVKTKRAHVKVITEGIIKRPRVEKAKQKKTDVVAILLKLPLIRRLLKSTLFRRLVRFLKRLAGLFRH